MTTASSPPTHSWRVSLGLGLVVAVLGGWSYSHCLFLFFGQDDFWLLNHAQQPEHTVLACFKGILPEYIRPITTCWTPCLLFPCCGVDPLFYKLFQLVVFFLSLGVLWLLLNELTHNTLAAWAGSVTFAFSPVHVFTLGWFAGIIDNLFLLFFLSALLVLARGVTHRSFSGPAVGMLMTAYVAALLSKENGILLFPIACAALGAVALFSRRRPSLMETGGLLSLTLLTMAYLVFRKLSIVSAADALNVNFTPSRAFTIWRYAIESLPLVSPVYLVWHPWLPGVFLMLFVLVPGCLGRSAQVHGWQGEEAHLFLATGLGLLLFVLNAAIFAFLPQPVVLADYYSTLCVVGIALLISCLLAQLMRTFPKRIPRLVVAILVGCYAWMGAGRVHGLIERNQSPSLFMAEKAQCLYRQIHPHIVKSQARTIVIRGTDKLTWWASGKGVMIPVMFPGKLASFPEFDGPRILVPPFLDLTLQADGTIQAAGQPVFGK